MTHVCYIHVPMVFPVRYVELGVAVHTMLPFKPLGFLLNLIYRLSIGHTLYLYIIIINLTCFTFIFIFSNHDIYTQHILNLIS